MKAILLVHIIAGTISVLAGAASLASRKGARLHRSAGWAFVVAMPIMGLTAAIIGRDNPGNAVAAGLVIYLIATSVVTARSREKRAGAFDIGAALAAFAFALLFGFSAYQIGTGRIPAANPVIFGVSCFLSAVLVLAGLGDLSVALRRGIAGAQRIARHLWRMCLGLFIAMGAFMAQGMDALPAGFPRVPILLGSLALVLLATIYWLIRVLFTRWRAYGSQVAQPNPTSAHLT